MIDASSKSAFCGALAKVKEKWDNLERSCLSDGYEPTFFDWFKEYKMNDIICCTLPEVRVKAGLVDPSIAFTTNASESLNNVIKMEVEWKKNKLPSLIEHLKSITERQTAELERAVIQRGEWTFKGEYRRLVISEAQWFSLSTAAKKKHMKLVSSYVPVKKGIVSSMDSSEGSSQVNPGKLSVCWEDCKVSKVSTTTLKSIWKKAETLIESKNVLSIPWNPDPRTRLVKSFSSVNPHTVMTNPKNKKMYICDDKCQMFKGFSLCSHVIATA